MANALNGEALLPLRDGRKLRVAYDFDGLIALEEASGMRMPEIYAELERLGAIKETPSMRLSRAILYGGLQQHHPEITLKEVGAIILDDTDALAAAFRAFEGSHGPEGEGGSAGDVNEDPPLRGARGTGRSSSKAGAGRGSRPRRSGAKPSGPTRKG
jgi:hypothetical protein